MLNFTIIKYLRLKITDMNILRIQKNNYQKKHN